MRSTATNSADGPEDGPSIEGVRNFRDVGGLNLRSGGRTRRGRLYRAAALGDLTERGADELGALGLRTILDLREDVERQRRPTRHVAAGVVVHELPLYRDRVCIEDFHGLVPLYAHVLRVCGSDMAAAVGRLATPGALPALVHCTAGKDRTGVLVALVLSAVGVPDDVVAQDYGRTAASFSKARWDTILPYGLAAGVDPQHLVPLLASPPEVLHELLEAVRKEYGSAAGYLLAQGVSNSALQSLRAELIEAD